MIKGENNYSNFNFLDKIINLIFRNLKLFSYSSCSTCRKAIQWLRSNGIDFELIDILNTPPSKEMLISASKQYGDRKYLVNTNGVIYRSIGSDIVKGMSDNKFFEKLFIEPRLIKRPFLFKPNKLFLVGFKEKKWAEELL